jgi:hypothetical protein
MAVKLGNTHKDISRSQNIEIRLCDAIDRHPFNYWFPKAFQEPMKLQA